MRSTARCPSGCLTRWLLAFLALSLLLQAGPARAQQPEPLRILLLEGPTPEWVRRVRGQLSDLSVSISTLALVVEGQPEAQLTRQLAPLAQHRDAALVAWLMTEAAEPRAASPVAGDLESAGRTQVAIWFARSGRFFARRLGGPWRELSAADRSGVLELGALSVRSAVRSLLLDPTQSEPFRAGAAAAVSAPGAAAATAGGAPSAASRAASGGSAGSIASSPAPLAPDAPALQGASDASELASAPELSEAAAPAASAPDAGAIVVPPSAALVATDLPSADRSAGESSAGGGSALELSWNAELGVVGQVPGPPGYAAAGLEAGLRARSNAWALVVLGQLGVPLRSELGPTEVELQQHALLAEAQYAAWTPGVWSLGPLLRAGIRFARRETLAGDATLAASATAWHEALRLGLGWNTEARWGTHFGASLRTVLHWEPSRPTYAVVTTSGDPVSRAEPWAVQPSLELSGNWYW